MSTVSDIQMHWIKTVEIPYEDKNTPKDTSHGILFPEDLLEYCVLHTTMMLYVFIFIMAHLLSFPSLCQFYMGTSLKEYIFYLLLKSGWHEFDNGQHL